MFFFLHSLIKSTQLMWNKRKISFFDVSHSFAKFYTRQNEKEMNNNKNRIKSNKNCQYIPKTLNPVL